MCLGLGKTGTGDDIPLDISSTLQPCSIPFLYLFWQQWQQARERVR